VRAGRPALLVRVVQLPVDAVPGFGLSSTMQLFLERAGVGFLRFGRPLTNKVGGVVVTGRKYSHGEVHSQLVNILLLNRLIIPGSGFPAVISTAGPDGALGDQEGLDAALRLVERMAELHATLSSARRALAVPGSVELRVGRTG
jgi:multimeric flavodoxin WrbA